MAVQINGDIKVIENPESHTSAQYTEDIISSEGGFLYSIDPYALGLISIQLGAGRTKKDDLLHMNAGIRLHKKVGDAVSSGDLLATVYAESEPLLKSQLERIGNTFEFKDEKPEIPELILEVI